MTGIIITLLFITVLFIMIGIGISSKSRGNVKSRKDNSTFIPPYIIGDSDHKHSQDHHDSNDSSGGFGDSSGDGGGGGGD